MTDGLSLTQRGMVARFYDEKLGRMPTLEEADAMLREELEEALLAMPNNEDYRGEAALMKELCDVLYVVNGYFLARDWDVNEAFWRVHRSNMLKPTMKTEEKPAPPGTKVPKGENYTPPELGDLLRD